MTFAVLAPDRRSLRTSLFALGLSTSFVASASAAPVEPDPSSPDAVDGDLGAIDDGPDTTPDTSPEPAPTSDEPAPEPEAEEFVDEDPETADEEPADEEPADEEPADEEPADEEPIRPPRVDGPYVGALAMGTVNFARVIDLETPSPLIGGGGFVQAGDAVFPWMSIGIAVGGQAAFAGKQRILEGALLVEFGFVPAKRYPLSIRAGFGFGGGAVREQDVAGRFGFGGALFKGSLRYEFFPLAAKNRPDRGGGWAIGPELGWLGATPSGKGQPFVNTILLGLSTSFYFGS